jgi:hypothetical protein
MDIMDGFATSSKEHLRSLVRVHELDEITSNGGKDRSVTKTELHAKRTFILDARITSSKSCKWRGQRT